NVGFHITGDAVHMMWDNDSAKSYVIYHSTRSDSAVLPFKDNTQNGDVSIFEADAAQAPYRFPDAKLSELDLRIPHYFTVVAQDNTTADKSNESGVVGFLLQKIPQSAPGRSNLEAPTGLVIKVVSKQSLLIKWNKVAGATSYTVYMDESPIPDDLSNFVAGGGARMVHKDEGNGVAEMSHGDLRTGTLYYIRVTAANDYGESSPSSEESATPLVPDNFLLSTVWAKNSVVERIGLLTQPGLFDYKLIPVQGNRVPSVQLIGIYPRDSATNYTKAQEILKGTAIDLQVALPMDGGQFLTAGNGAGSEAGTDAYYLAVDPNGKRSSFQAWKELNGIAFKLDPTDPSSITYEVPDAQALFFNGKDHELARIVTMKRLGGNVAFYADHFASLQDAVIDDSTARTAKLKETVAIEFSAPEPGGNARSTDRYLKFFAFNRKGERIKSIDLDGRGPKFLPEACVVCHAGNARTYAAGDTTAYPKQGNVDARFIPLNLDAFDFLESDPVFNRSTQELEFKYMNEAVRDAYGVSKTITRVYNQYVEVLAGAASVVNTNDFCDATAGTGVTGCTDQTPGVRDMAATVVFQEGVVDDVNVHIDFLSHPDLSELQLSLVSPAGTVVDLVSRISPSILTGAAMGVSTNPESIDGGITPAASLQPAVFDDENSQLIGNGSAPYIGRWKPASPLDVFDGEDAVGRWKLQVFDYVSGNTGTVEAWSLELKVKAPAVELIEGWYGGKNLPNTTHNGAFIPRGWDTISSVNKFYTDNPSAVDGPRELYSKVIKESCRVCHLQRGSTGSILDFATWDNFNKDSGNLEKNQRWLNRIEHEVYVEGNMPRAFPTFKQFWMSDQPTILAKFLRPGSADPIQPAAISGLKGAGNPFLHPSEGRNVVLDTTTPVEFGARVEHFTSTKDANGGAPLYNGTYSWNLISSPASSSAGLSNSTSRNPSIIPDVAGTYIVEGTVGVNGISSNMVTDRIFVNAPINTTSFAEIYKNILKLDCKGCHRSGGPADHTGYLADREVYQVDTDNDPATTAIQGIYDLVVNKDFRIHPAATTESRLLKKPSSIRQARDGDSYSNKYRHGGGVRKEFDIRSVDRPNSPNFGKAANYDLIKNWIDLRANTANGKPPEN
ncbi:MAG: proprotein convertase P-domain-containing protein, partial [Thiohalomonadales bacterium]